MLREQIKNMEVSTKMKMSPSREKKDFWDPGERDREEEKKLFLLLLPNPYTHPIIVCVCVCVCSWISVIDWNFLSYFISSKQEILVENVQMGRK